LKTHTELLNYLATKHNLKSYLEIGVQNPANNFDKIVCVNKLGVDPELDTTDIIFGDTSDYFFFGNKNTFDLIFIDGLHHADQVKRDFDNSLRCLNAGGYIVIHDTLPENEAGTIVPRETRQWWGDVYKFAMELRSYKFIQYFTVKMDNGCTVVWKDDTQAMSIKYNGTIDWPYYGEYKNNMLHLIQPSEIGNYF